MSMILQTRITICKTAQNKIFKLFEIESEEKQGSRFYTAYAIPIRITSQTVLASLARHAIIVELRFPTK